MNPTYYNPGCSPTLLGDMAQEIHSTFHAADTAGICHPGEGPEGGIGEQDVHSPCQRTGCGGRASLSGTSPTYSRNRLWLRADRTEAGPPVAAGPRSIRQCPPGLSRGPSQLSREAP